MTVKPYDDKLEDYFKEIDAILMNSTHQLIAFGQKTTLIQNHKFKSKIKLYLNISNLLKDL